MPLTNKQSRFCQEYVTGLNATAAAIRAGYSAKTANRIGSENLSKPDIREKIAELQEEISAKLEVTTERIVRELAKIAFDETDKFKPRERMRALELLGKHRQMFTDRASGEDNSEPQVVVYWPNNGKDPSAAERTVHLDSPEARAIIGE